MRESPMNAGPDCFRSVESVQGRPCSYLQFLVFIHILLCNMLAPLYSLSYRYLLAGVISHMLLILKFLLLACFVRYSATLSVVKIT